MRRTLSSFPALAFLTVPLIIAAATPGPKQADVMVEIDGKSFTASDVYRTNPGATFQQRNALFEAEQKAVEEFVNNYVLNQEAQKQKLTVEQLLERQAYSSLAKDPSEEALRVYYDGIDTAEPFETVKVKIADLIKQRRMAKAKTAYIQQLRGRAEVAIRLQPPRAPIEVGDAPVRGKREAPVTIIEYADYECPYCQTIQPVIERLEKEFSGKIAFAFKDVPLPMHANAQKAAEAAHCAGVQGKFWEYHDRLFATRQFAGLNLKEHALALGLDQPKFETCLSTGAQAARIQKYVAEAQAISLPGTPAFFVNGKFLNGAIDYEVLRRAVEEELRAAGAAQTAQRQERE